MHHLLTLYLTFWRSNPIAAGLWHGFIFAALVSNKREKRLIRKEGKPDARYI